MTTTKNNNNRRYEGVICNSFGDPRLLNGIDRVELAFHESIETSPIIARLRAYGEKPEPWYAKPGWVLNSKVKFKDLRFKIPSRTDWKTTGGIIFNPNHYSSFKELCRTLHLFLDPRSLVGAKIKRLDFHADLFEPFVTVRKYLDVKLKKKARIFSENIETGIEYGKGEERISVYDRANLEAEIPGLLTRIEVRQTGRKLFQLTWDEFPTLPSLLRERKIEPFKRVFLQPLQIRSLEEDSIREDIIKHTELRVSLEQSGFTQTRKLFNKNRNFYRDYGKFLEIFPRFDLHSILVQQVTEFMKEEVENV